MEILQAQEGNGTALKVLAQDQKYSASRPGTAGQAGELKSAQKDVSSLPRNIFTTRWPKSPTPNSQKAPLELYKDSPQGENKGAHE